MAFDFSGTSGPLEAVYGALTIADPLKGAGKLTEADLADALGVDTVSVKILTDLHTDFVQVWTTLGWDAAPGPFVKGDKQAKRLAVVLEELESMLLMARDDAGAEADDEEGSVEDDRSIEESMAATDAKPAASAKKGTKSKKQELAVPTDHEVFAALVAAGDGRGVTKHCCGDDESGPKDYPRPLTAQVSEMIKQAKLLMRLEARARERSLSPVMRGSKSRPKLKDSDDEDDEDGFGFGRWRYEAWPDECAADCFGGGLCPGLEHHGLCGRGLQALCTCPLVGPARPSWPSLILAPRGPL
jgi:hypothetical protein